MLVYKVIAAPSLFILWHVTTSVPEIRTHGITTRRSRRRKWVTVSCTIRGTIRGSIRGIRGTIRGPGYLHYHSLCFSWAVKIRWILLFMWIRLPTALTMDQEIIPTLLLWLIRIMWLLGAWMPRIWWNCAA